MVQQIDPNVHCVMCKCTEVPVLTLHTWAYRIPVGVGGAELRLVFIRVVELLNAIVSVGAVVSIRTFLARTYEFAKLGSVSLRGPSSIFIRIVVVDTTLRIVSIWSRAGH